MPIKEQPQPSPFRQFNNIFLGLGALFLVVSFVLPLISGPRIPGVPYSLFIHQVEGGEVSRVQVGQNEIRFQLKSETDQAGQLFSTTPIFDLGLPKLLEEKGVEFAAAPPPKNGWLNNIFSWVIPPLIFVGILQFFSRRNSGAPPGMLSIGKSKAKVYVEGESAKTTFADGHAFPRAYCSWDHREQAKLCWPKLWQGRQVSHSSAFLAQNL
jgi:cell division protease FtsH